MKHLEYFEENGWLKSEYLWPLRQDICLGSIYYTDYNNRFGIDCHLVCDFFDGFISFINELWSEKDDNGKPSENVRMAIVQHLSSVSQDVTEENIEKVWKHDDTIQYELFDNVETLLEWYGCFCDNPFPKRKYEVFLQCLIDNSDTDEDYNEWDVEETFHVMAYSEEQAKEIVQDAIDNASFTDWPDMKLASELHPEFKPGRYLWNLTLSSNLIK